MRSIPHNFRLVLLALLFALSSCVAAAASVHSCCPTGDCDLAHCMDMGCAPALPVLAFNKPALPREARTSEPHAIAATPAQPERYEEVWTPPD